jgi:hypothetical protein
MRTIFAVVLVAVAALPASAQIEPFTRRPYVQFEFDPQVEDHVKARLQQEHDLGPLKDLVKQILENPEQFPFDPEKFKDLKLDDPKLKKAVENWAKEDPSLKKTVEAWIKKQPANNKQPAELKKLQQGLQKIIEKAPPSDTSRPVVKDRQRRIPQVDPVAKATERVMNDAQEGRLGEWLSDSPAVKQALQDLRASINNPDGSGWNAGDWQHRLGIDEQKAWRLGTDTFRRLRDMPQPRLGELNWQRRLPGIGEIPTVNFGPPALPTTYSGPSLPTIGTGLTWVLLIALTLLFGWQLLRWSSRRKTASDARAALGPWPVRPDAVSTRAELVQAFDYLALLTLGVVVTSWNHLAVAKRWSEQTPAHAPLAQTLASLYEASRYTEGVEELATAQREQARHALAQLAEAL